ncbi:SMI1/KNR4 family protein [Streptomyces atroolivaceus]|uniref:SMI1/KNR4 family protein n=1 Tax=Streptomyces atroolivaceus TaxID=66869 RepID=UPI00379CD6E0
MVEQSTPVSSVGHFATWEPLLRILLAGDTERSAGRSARVGGRIGRHGCSLRRQRRGRMAPADRAVVEQMQGVLARGGVEEVAFRAEVRPTGRTTLTLVWPCPAVEAAFNCLDLGVLVLVEGSLPEPWRRLPDPVPGVVPAPSVDLHVLERTLREHLPDSVGATEEEIVSAEARLGVPLPDELKVLYRVARARRRDRGDDHEARARADSALGFELRALDELYSVEPVARLPHWGSAAKTAVSTPPDAVVQHLAGSPGWIVFGGGGDELAVDLTPGPRGHVGQVILVDHEQSIGAHLVADSLTDLVLNRVREERRVHLGDQRPLVAEAGSTQAVEAAAHPALEVLSIREGDGAPVSLGPVTGLPRLRTLGAAPGTLADPLEIARFAGLEFLELGPQDWRVLLDAGAVPRTLMAAAVGGRADQDALKTTVANELLALWGRPRITRTLLEGDLGPVT